MHNLSEICEEFRGQLTGPRLLLIAHISIGLDQSRFDLAKQQIGCEICTHFPGVTILESAGFWRTDGQLKLLGESFSVLEEQVATVLLQIHPDQQKLALKTLSKSVQAAAEKYGFLARYIHAEIIHSNAMHLDLEKLTTLKVI